MEPDTRNRILDAALRLFAEHGLEATRAGDICAKAGISNGSLFHFFPTKEAIAVALYVEAIASYQSALLVALRAARSPASAVRNLVLAQCRWVETEEPRARFLFAQGPAKWSREARREVDALNARFAAAIEGWRDNPAVQSALRRLPIEAFLAILIGPSFMAIRGWLAGLQGPPFSLAATFADAAVRSLLKEPKHER
jgi:AcrR family transcriptional regulator